MAEIVRGGLQSVPRGQYEAAKALGLSPTRQTALIVLPQALRNVIPAQIGQLISLFKDTSLAGAAMGLFELIEVSTVITQQGEFRGQGLIGETIAFAALMFWTVSYTMSRESQRLERRLGVGTTMSDATESDPNVFADATQVAGTREAIIELDGVEQVLRLVPGAEGHQPATSGDRRWSSSSGRRGRGSRR